MKKKNILGALAALFGLGTGLVGWLTIKETMKEEMHKKSA